MSAAVPDASDGLAEALERATAIPQPEQAMPEPAAGEEIPIEAYEDEPRASADAAVTLEDFLAFMPMHKYVFRPTRELWGAASVNSRIPPIRVGAERKIPASVWLDQNRAVEQMTWSPGHPEIIEGQLIDNGGWFERVGCRTFNLYRPPVLLPGDSTEAGPWLAHLERIYPNEADHIIKWLAHRVQRPGEKINHALVLGGAAGIGKDTLLQPALHAVGTWNCHEVSPTQLMGRFNGFLKAVILRVSEARDQGEAGGGKVDRYALHEHCKTIIAAPPDVLRCDQKNLQEHSITNVVGVVFTTNHRDGLYITIDDRRHFVAWSELVKTDFGPTYWIDINHWYRIEGGLGHVAAYLRSVDLSGFDPKAPPPRTAAFHRMVDAGRAPEDAELADALDALSEPVDGDPSRRERLKVLTVAMVASHTASDSFRAWIPTERTPGRSRTASRMPDMWPSGMTTSGMDSGCWTASARSSTPAETSRSVTAWLPPPSSSERAGDERRIGEISEVSDFLYPFSLSRASIRESDGWTENR